MAEKKNGCLMKVLVAVLVVVVVFAVLVFATPTEEPPFNEDDIVGMETSEAAAVFEEAGYDVTVLSETGYELSADGLTASMSMKWYVYSCDADHAADAVEVVVISEASSLYADIA